MLLQHPEGEGTAEAVGDDELAGHYFGERAAERGGLGGAGEVVARWWRAGQREDEGRVG